MERCSLSLTLINLSPDLKRLEDDGYELGVRSGYLLLKQVPYVTESGNVKRGTLVSELTLEGDTTARPNTHVVMFFGDTPCDPEGCPLNHSIISSVRKELGCGLAIDHVLSRKPPEGYVDYYQKMTTYVDIISRPAQQIDPTTTARTFAVVEAEESDSVFRYLDTASSRADIGSVSDKLKVGPIAIVGLGGTGSYILDLVAKTPVREIHLFDGDKFGQHNAFRSPGAASIATLRRAPQKAAYYKQIYAEMRRNIFVHEFVDETTVDCLRSMDFVFIAVDEGSDRRFVVDKLEEFQVPFIDVGMGVEEVEGSLTGQLRVSLSTAQSRTQIRSTLPLADREVVDDYSRNIQIADLNALNAVLAVIKWKKHIGFYMDLEKEHSSYFQIDGNCLINQDQM